MRVVIVAVRVVTVSFDGLFFLFAQMLFSRFGFEHALILGLMFRQGTASSPFKPPSLV